MSLSVGLNGFGHIGRIILRTCFVRSNIEIIAINDPVIDIEYICYLIKFDSTHGKFNAEISYSDNEITINGKKIKVFHEKIPSSIPWHTLGVEYVVEASGMFSNMDKALGHLISTSLKCVLVTSPSADIPMLILGVNEQIVKKDERVISCASSTLYCLAPIVKVLEDNYGISEGFVTSIHSMTPSLKPLDGLCLKGRHWRDHRGIHQNIIPAATAACKALGKIIPSVNDKFCGLAFRVPIVNVSVLDVTVRLNKSTSIREIAAQIEKERTGKMKNIVSTSYDEAVSSDFMNNENSCILDVNASLELTPTSFKLICWYENEYSYACRVIDTIFFLQDRLKTQECFVPIKLKSDSACEAIRNPDVFKKNKNTKIYSNISLRNRLNNKVPNVYSQSSPDMHSNQKAGTNMQDKKAPVKIIVCDNSSNTNTQGMNIQSSNIFENRERLELAKKELAKITSKTEDLLKETNQMEAKENLDTTVLEISMTNDKINFLDDNNIKTTVELKNEDSYKYSSNVKVHKINSLLNILNKINTNNVDETTIDIREKVDATHESVIKESIVKKEIMEEEPKSQNMSLHNLEASIIISDKDGKEHTIVSIKSKQNINTLTDHKVLNTTKQSQEHSNYEKSENNITEQNDVDFPSESGNNKSLTKNNENNIIDIQNKTYSNNCIANKNSNNILLLMTTGSLESNKWLKLDANYTDHILQMTEQQESKNQIIKKKMLSSVLKTTKGDILPMFDSLTLINKRECIAKENLLDKLASETDSDYSLRMDETKSQVIDITDLSSSTDDLARLDKICRIIEISDELSDELFSALNVNSESGKKEWSLKELCEKIKLDDFCHKIFGQSI